MKKVLLVLAIVFLVTAAENSMVPFKNVEEWLSQQVESRSVKRSDQLLLKAAIVHSIDRREISAGKKTNSFGRANYQAATELLSRAKKSKGELVERTLENNEVHYYYYKTSEHASVKATLAWLEKENSNLNIRVIRDGGAIRPWSQDNSGSYSRSEKETGATVERVDTEVKKGDEIIIKVSAPKGLTKSVKYVLFVTGCEFSNRQINQIAYNDALKKSDNLKHIRVKDYLKKHNAKIDSILPNGKTLHMIDVVDGKPVYYSTFNSNAAKSASLNEIRPGGSQNLSLTGSGLERSLGIWDEGTVRSTHQEVTGRITLGDNVPPKKHSSHVGGTMIASGVKAKAKGMAYEAELKSFDWNNDESEMASEASKGLIISQHSYGITGDYTYSRAWDKIANNYPMYTISKSAANDGAFRTVSLNGNCKNVMTIGSALDQPNGWQGAGTNNGTLSSFSSKGPAPDGRIKPDILANGQDLYSIFETSNNAYGSMSGTSMSGPSYAGCVALIQEHYYNTHSETYMNAATLKALIIQTADEVDADGPDYSSGWGYINAASAAKLISADDGGAMQLIQVQTLESNKEFVLNTIHNNGEDVDVTIVWNDPAPTSNNGKALVNDLDLRVSVDGVEKLPWMMDWNGSTNNIKAKRGDNTLDNVEKVQIKNVTGSEIIITVSNKGSLKNGSQEFSLIISGASVNVDPYLRVSAPNGGEEIEQFSDYTINWGSNVDEPVDILLLKGNNVVDTLAKTYTNSGSFVWSIPEDMELGNNYKIKISCITSTDINDESNEFFSIIPEFIISEFPHVEPYEEYEVGSSSVGKWTQEKDADDIDWLVYSGITPTGQYGVDVGEDPGTGPLGDHTSGSGKYIYIESSSNYEDNKKGDLITPKFDIRALKKPMLEYWLQMNSKNGLMGEIAVDVAVEGIWTKDIKSYTGDKGLEWFSDSIDLSPYIGKRVQVRFRSTVGDSFYSDICLDDFKIFGITNTAPLFITSTLNDAKEGVAYKNEISVSDADGDNLTINKLSGPSWILIGSVINDKVSLTGMPNVGDASDTTIELKLSDGISDVSKIFGLKILANSAPKFTSTPILEVNPEDIYTYDITLTDDDSENSLDISSQPLPTWLTLDDLGDGVAKLYGTPQKSDSGNYEIVILGDDGVINSDVKQQFEITVLGNGIGILTGKDKYNETGLKIVPSILSDNKIVDIYIVSTENNLFDLNIYDNLGNVIYQNSGIMRIKSSNLNLAYCDSWDGKNRNSRSVGSGLYTVIIKVTQNSGSIKLYKTSIGVKR